MVLYDVEEKALYLYVKNQLFYNTKIVKTCIFEVFEFKIINFAVLDQSQSSFSHD